jgi:hypothetical protein
MTPESQKKLAGVMAGKQDVTTGFRSNGYACNNRGTVGNGVFYCV